MQLQYLRKNTEEKGIKKGCYVFPTISERRDDKT